MHERYWIKFATRVENSGSMSTQGVLSSGWSGEEHGVVRLGSVVDVAGQDAENVSWSRAD